MSHLRFHYSKKNIEVKILNAIKDVGLDPNEIPLSPIELSSLDHFHTGGLNASYALMELANIRSQDNILDLGSGLAGPARFLAYMHGCTVDCLEMSNDYCIAAALLNRLTGLEDFVNVQKGNAQNIPFPSNAFDVVWMQNVGMNIQDKCLLFEEIHRVLRPNGRFAFQEMVAGHFPTTYFPLPWASSADEQFLISFEQTRELLIQIGYKEEYYEDVSFSPLPNMVESTFKDRIRFTFSLSVYVDNLSQKANNAIQSLEEEQIRLVRGIFRSK